MTKYEKSIKKNLLPDVRALVFHTQKQKSEPVGENIRKSLNVHPDAAYVWKVSGKMFSRSLVLLSFWAPTLFYKKI